MKKVVFLILISLFSNIAMADCDWTKIKENSDGTFTYSKDLHLCVGKMKQDLAVVQKQLDDNKKVIELKDLALTKSDERTKMWMDNSDQLMDRVNKIESLENSNKLLYFGLGIGLTVLSVFAARQVITH